MKKIHLKYPVIVEGKYDKIKLSNILSSSVISIGGFSFMNDKKKKKLLSALADETKLIILTDSDKAGAFIRSRLKGIISPEKLIHLHIPQIKGKEKRKQRASAEGFLGVEGISADILRERILSLIDLHPEVAGGEKTEAESITKTDFYFAGLSGGDNSAEKRDRLAAEVALPAKMSANALLSALNMIITKEVFNSICGKLDFYKEN